MNTPLDPYGVNDEGEDLHPDAVLARALARRGDTFDEFKLLIREQSATYDLISKTAGYVHHYTGKTGSAQQLSGVMRELITLCQLCAKGEHRFSPNHVRRLYCHGVTNNVMFEAASAMAPVTGWTTIAHVATASAAKTRARSSGANAGQVHLAYWRSWAAICLATADAFGNCLLIRSSVRHASGVLSISRIARASFTSPVGALAEVGYSWISLP
jgi:alkylhydroperoxidase/carboxymuconolactone decarboxylase family protein YurZ